MGKYLLILILICGFSIVFGRAVSMAVLSLFLIPVLYVHGYYLPMKKGITGWTGEPKSKYYDVCKWNKDLFSK
ncbi:MAG TPA: hypothetical protein VM187_06260 [Niastella sp.]|nr:hypothetical protein [Niastella sp.]